MRVRDLAALLTTVGTLSLAGAGATEDKPAGGGEVGRFIALVEGHWTSVALPGRDECVGRTLSLIRAQPAGQAVPGEVWLSSVTTEPNAKPHRRRLLLQPGAESADFTITPYAQVSGLSPDEPAPEVSAEQPITIPASVFRPERACQARMMESDARVTVRLCGRGGDRGNWLSAPSMVLSADTMQLDARGFPGGGCRFVRTMEKTP
jgi:hypothetical protein